MIGVAKPKSPPKLSKISEISPQKGILSLFCAPHPNESKNINQWLNIRTKILCLGSTLRLSSLGLELLFPVSWLSQLDLNLSSEGPGGLQTEADEAQPSHQRAGDDAPDEEPHEAAERGDEVQAAGVWGGEGGLGGQHEADHDHFISVLIMIVIIFCPWSSREIWSS